MKPRIIFLPFAGGNQYSYFSLRQHLSSSGIDSLVLELPGRASRILEPLVYDIHQLTQDAHRQCEPALKTPFILYGDCMGAILAFLLCHELRIRNCLSPYHLVVTNCGGPSNFAATPSERMTDEAIRRQLLDFGTAEELVVNESFFEMMRPIIIADAQAFSTYHYQKMPSLDVHITAIVDNNADRIDKAEKWKGETTGKFVLKTHETDGLKKALILNEILDEIIGEHLVGPKFEKS